VLQDRPVYANKTLLVRLGYTEEELVQVPLERIIESIPNGGPLATGSERRARIIAKEGVAADVLLAAAPVTIGDKAGQILSVRDVSTRRQTEETVARLVVDLQSMLTLATRSVKASPLTLTTCELNTLIHEAAAAMSRAKSSAILVQSSAGEPIGIVTDQDLRNRVLAAGQPATQPVATIMSAPLICIDERALLFEAARVMQERNVQHLVVTDERGATTTSAAVTVIVNAGPTVSLTAPASGSVVQAPGSVLLSADAADADGKVTKVDFYQGSTLIGTATTAPYTLPVSNLTAGIYSFTAAASDDRGGATTSSATTLIVNAAPAASLTSPTSNAVFSAPANIPITADVADTDGTVSSVEFYFGTTLIATKTAPPYSVVWTGVPQGTYSLSARALDNNSGTDLPPDSSTKLMLVESAFQRRSGHEEAVYRRADHRVFERGQRRCGGEGIVQEARLQ
jgi:CBS domain-containing protein